MYIYPILQTLFSSNVVFKMGNVVFIMSHVDAKYLISIIYTITVKPLYSGHPWDKYKCPDYRGCPHFSGEFIL